MKVLFDIVHPADVLFFYHPINTLQKQGHQVIVASREKDVTVELLEAFGLPHTVISKASSGIIGLASELLIRDVNLFKLVKRTRPDVMIGFGGVSISHIGKLFQIPSISFYDTETAPLQHMITLPFITEMHVPDCYDGKIAKNRTHRFAGQKDFSYLHPDNFQVNEELAKQAGYQADKPNYFIRIVAWNANHDIGNQGWNVSTLRRLVEHLMKKGIVHISSESELPADLKQYEYHGQVHHIHHLVAMCKAYIGESATMAGEAIMLGTPAICAADIKLGYTDELAERQLLWNITTVDFDTLVNTLAELENQAKGNWQTKREEYFAGKPNLADTVLSSILKYNPATEQVC